MDIKSSNFLLLFPLPVVFFILGYMENLGFFSEPAALEYIIIPLSLIILLIYCYKSSPAFLFTSGMTFYYYIGMCVSLLMVSSGLHMIEINKIGNGNGAAFIMLSFFVFSLGISKTSFEFTLKKTSNNYISRLSLKLVSTALLIIISSVLILGFFIFLVYSGPVLKGVNRVEFWESMKSTGLSFFPTLVIQSFYFVVFYYLHKKYDKKRRRVGLFLLLSYLITTILVLGAKFSAFIIYITVFFSILPSFHSNIIFRARTFFLMGLVFCALISIVALFYILQGRDGSFIFVRAALQGQLMWSVHNGNFPTLLADNFSCFWGCDGFNSGADYISYKYLPTATYTHYINTGTNLSGFAPALQLLTLGIIPTVILQTIVSGLLGFLQARMVIYNSQRNFIMGFLLFKLSFTVFLIWYAIMFTALTGGILTILAIVLYIILCKSTDRKKSLETSKHAA
ncbi:hypothetical protein [Mixta calida]|uniref:hypothetical protein n=1 Tax=Mixta calida TaxID=665913 RepID=UPI002908334F|nr:hypothetical protein [Pantoea sp.]